MFSATKGVTALAVALAVSRGLIDYDAKVADYWPEFAQAGKGAITVRQLLSHQAGLVVIDPPLVNPFGLSAKAIALADGKKDVDINSDEIRALEIPAGNGTGTARSLAKLYGVAAAGGSELGLNRPSSTR